MFCVLKLLIFRIEIRKCTRDDDLFEITCSYSQKQNEKREAGF